MTRVLHTQLLHCNGLYHNDLILCDDDDDDLFQVWRCIARDLNFCARCGAQIVVMSKQQ